MPLKIGSCVLFSHQSKNKESLSKSKTDKKASTIANQALGKGNTTCTGADNVSFIQKGNLSSGKLSSDRVDIIATALKMPQTKEKPIPPPRSSTTCLNPELSKIGEQEKVLGSDLLSAVVHTKNTLKSTDKRVSPKPLPRSHTICLNSTPECSKSEKLSAENTSLLPPPQENKPKLESVSMTDAILSLERRVPFQTEETTKNLGTSSSATTCPTKSILEKNPSFNNTEEKLNDGWDEVDKILNECREYLNNFSFS